MVCVEGSAMSVMCGPMCVGDLEWKGHELSEMYCRCSQSWGQDMTGLAPSSYRERILFLKEKIVHSLICSHAIYCTSQCQGLDWTLSRNAKGGGRLC